MKFEMKVVLERPTDELFKVEKKELVVNMDEWKQHKKWWDAAKEQGWTSNVFVGLMINGRGTNLFNLTTREAFTVMNAIKKMPGAENEEFAKQVRYVVNLEGTRATGGDVLPVTSVRKLAKRLKGYSFPVENLELPY